MDDSSVEKAWERPWSTEEIRSHCSSWNLAGDAGLLKHLQEFSQNLMQKTHTAEVALDSLIEDMRNTSVDVQNATNALLMLSNNQFVENRVYDDCEDEKEEAGGANEDGDKVTSAASGGNIEGMLIAKATEAILLGMSVIESKFECVEVPASDSEGEEDAQNTVLSNSKSFALVLEPKNPYASQPLPHLIGSKEFMEDDQVGLGGGEEEDEDDEDDAQLSLGQATQGLNDSGGSSLAGDMGDEGIFDEEDDLDDQRATKGPRKQAWESSSSNGSDDLMVESNVIRKKKTAVATKDDNKMPSHGNEEVDGDLFGGKDSPLGDEFMEPVQTIRPLITKSQKEDFDGGDKAVAGKAVKDVHKKREDEPEAKKTADANIPHIIPSDNLFGPPKDEWKDDDDGDSIFAASDGIFSGGRGLFDDLEDPFTSGNQRDAIRFNPPSLPDQPPPFRGADGNTVVPNESKDIFGDDDDDGQDVFASILTKAKSPPQQQSKTKVEQALKKHLPNPEKPKGKDVKGVGVTEAEDDWLFDEPDLDEGKSMWSNGKEEKISNHKAVRKVETFGEKNEKSTDDELKEDGKATIEPKLPVGARSFYAGGIDPMALGKKLTKELEGKRRITEERASEKNASEGKDAVNSKIDTPDQKPLVVEKRSVKAPPDPRSLFDDLGDGDDLFASASSKTNKPKDILDSGKGDLIDENLFAPNKSASFATKVEETQKKSSKQISSGVIDASKNLFGDFASDEDDIFAGPKALGPRSLSSKSVSNKGQKAYSESPDPLFDDILRKDEELFPASLKENIFSEKEVEDDIFSDFNEVDASIKMRKDESSNAIKTEIREVPLCADDKSIGLGNGRKVDTHDRSNDSDDLFGSYGIKSVEKDYSKLPRKIEASSSAKEKPPSAKNTKVEFDNIFRDSDDKLFSVDAVGSIDTLPRIAEDTAKSTRAKKLENKHDEASKLDNLFDDFVDDGGDDFLSTLPGAARRKPGQVSEDSLFSSKAMSSSKDLFSELDSDGDDQKFFTPRGGKAKEDMLDPSIPDDSLLSSGKHAMAKKIPSPPSFLKGEPPLDFSHEKMGSRKKTEWTAASFEVSATSRALASRSEESSAQVGPIAATSGARKSPPKTLNLEKVIPSPKPEGKLDEEETLNDAEDDRIVQAWMKGQPPPLRDSKVESDVTTPSLPSSFDDYGPAKHDYFADIPSASLLHSHGKERARIQSHRRPPSRKIRKGSAASVDPLVAATADNEVKPEPVLSAAIVVPPSKDPSAVGEEDRGSQGTSEEWSTPEAGLASPPPAPLPRSNPLSPSTDEEQDFFDVLPIGHYPPPMEHSSSQVSPFSDVPGGVEEAWDDGALFEDARPMDGGSLWGDADALPANETLGEEVGSGRSEGAVAKRGREGDARGEDLFTEEEMVVGEEQTIESTEDRKAKKRVVVEGLDEDLWGNGFSSKDDIFAGPGPAQGGDDLDDIFQGGGDLFGSSKALTSSQETKKVPRGVIISKGMGKSLTKLESKSKAPVSLFDDDDDDTQDLFSAPHSNQTASARVSNSVKKSNSVRPAEQPAKSSLIKVTAVGDDAIFEDPLMVLKRKE